jgi:hypothetical protein
MIRSSANGIIVSSSCGWRNVARAYLRSYWFSFNYRYLSLPLPCHFCWNRIFCYIYDGRHEHFSNERYEGRTNFSNSPSALWILSSHILNLLSFRIVNTVTSRRTVLVCITRSWIYGDVDNSVMNMCCSRAICMLVIAPFIIRLEFIFSCIALIAEYHFALFH